MIDYCMDSDDEVKSAIGVGINQLWAVVEPWSDQLAPTISSTEPESFLFKNHYLFLLL